MAANTYDKTSPKSIEAYAKRLIGHTFLDVLEGRLADTDTVAEQAESYGNKNRKYCSHECYIADRFGGGTHD